MSKLTNQEKWEVINNSVQKNGHDGFNRNFSEVMYDWGFLIIVCNKLDYNLNILKNDSEEKAFDSIFDYCVKTYGFVPKNQLGLFEERCACGKNPACVCEKD